MFKNLILRANMLCKLIFICVLFVTVLWTDEVIADDDEDECECVLFEIQSDVGKCSGWDDAPTQVNMQMKKQKEAEDLPEVVVLTGNIDVGEALKDGYQMNIAVNLQTPNGKEMVWSGGAELCKSLSDEDAPWSAITSAMNTTKCPVPADVYDIPGMTMSLDWAQGMITADFVGSYMIMFTMEYTNNKIMCMEFGADIFQETRKRADCNTCPPDE